MIDYMLKLATVVAQVILVILMVAFTGLFIYAMIAG